MNVVDIFITEKKDNGRTLQIPYLPDKIRFKANGTRFASYDILDKGEAAIPTGENLRGFSWESVLPGEHSPYRELQHGAWVNPSQWQSIWSSWKKYGTPLRLVITGTPVNHDVYLDDYDVEYSGAYGDYFYNISFLDESQLTITVIDTSADTSTEQQETVRSETVSSTETYTVVKGDNLWSIAVKFLGDGSRWQELYTLNKDIIDQTAKEHGQSSSNNGSLIFPGTVLKVKE